MPGSALYMMELNADSVAQAKEKINQTMEGKTMIDIHSHIVFDVDDGPKTIEDSKLLIEESYRQGVRTIVSTSHRRKGMFETPEEKIYQNYLAVKEMVATYIPEMTLHFGAEIYYTRDILEKLEAGTIPTLAETSFALIEFSMATPTRRFIKP